jgi:hypothetical protein
MAKKHSRRHSRKHRTHKRRHHRMRGGESAAASVIGDTMKAMSQQSLAQGQQFASMHANQHGGAGLDAGPFPGAVTEQALIPANLMNAARVAPLNAALNAIANMKDPGQAGGGRRRKGRKASKKASRKGRKATRKGRKATRKGRKGSRKSRKTRRMRGGAFGDNAQSVTAPGMLLDSAQMGKALSGMNAEWKLAENPAAFAPGVAKNYA